MNRNAASVVLFLFFLTAVAIAEPLNPQAIFGQAPANNLQAAEKRTKAPKKVLLFTYDPRGDYNEQGLQLKYFMELKETKDLVKKNFTLVLLPISSPEAAPYLEKATNTERPLYFLLGADGQILAQGFASVNQQDGLRIVKELLAK